MEALTMFELLLGIVSVLIIPIAGVLIKNWSDVQQLKSNYVDVKEEIKDLENNKNEHSKSLALIDQKLQHIDLSINSLTASVNQLIELYKPRI